MNEQEIIYRCSWFDSKRHIKSHTSMYWKELKDTNWIFDTCSYKNGLARVSVIKVSKNSEEYDMAINNSNIKEKDCEFCKEQYPNQIGKADSTCGQCGTSICGACDCDCKFSKELRNEDDEERKLYKWMVELKEKYKQGTLEQKYIDQLELLPLWKWD